MSTKREQIVLAVMAALAGTVDVGTRIFRSREEALNRDEAPALAVAWEDEDPTEELSGLIEKKLTVVVSVYTRGDEPDALADPIVESVHSKIMAETTLGGLAIDVSEGGTSREGAEADQTAGFVNMRFVVWYRHQRANLSG